MTKRTARVNKGKVRMVGGGAVDEKFAYRQQY